MTEAEKTSLLFFKSSGPYFSESQARYTGDTKVTTNDRNAQILGKVRRDEMKEGCVVTGVNKWMPERCRLWNELYVERMAQD